MGYKAASIYLEDIENNPFYSYNMRGVMDRISRKNKDCIAFNH